MFEVFKMFAVRIIVTALFAFAGPLLLKLGITSDGLTDYIISILGGGVSLGVILAGLKKALLSDPEAFKAKIFPKR